jgi:hypothetical protein
VELDRLEAELADLRGAIEAEEVVLAKRGSDLTRVSEQAAQAADQAERASALAAGDFLGETAFRIADLSFESESDRLTEESKRRLDQLAERLEIENTGYFVEIHLRPEDGTSTVLEAARGEAVRRYLHEGGRLPLHAIALIADRAPGETAIRDPNLLETAPSLELIVQRAQPKP